MQVVVQILSQLGANQTAIIQFIIFLLAISFLTIFVYGPYFKAYDQRLAQTKGADEVAQDTQQEAKKIEAIYQTRAREINEKIKNIFDNSRAQAGESAARLTDSAKSTAAQSLDSARKEIAAQKQNATKEIQKISTEIAAEISKKITGAI